MENHISISVPLQADQWRKSFTTYVVSLNSCDLLFLSALVYMQKHIQGTMVLKSFLMVAEKKVIVSLLRKKLFPFSYYVLVSWFSVWKTALWKIKNGLYFPNHNMLIWTLIWACQVPNTDFPWLVQNSRKLSSLILEHVLS